MFRLFRIYCLRGKKINGKKRIEETDERIKNMIQLYGSFLVYSRVTSEQWECVVYDFIINL